MTTNFQNPLDDPELECAAQLHWHMSDKHQIASWRVFYSRNPDLAKNVVSEARRQIAKLDAMAISPLLRERWTAPTTGIDAALKKAREP